jgi:hypothetical protein
MNPLAEMSQQSEENYIHKNLNANNLYINNYNTQNFYSSPYNYPQYVPKDNTYASNSYNQNNNSNNFTPQGNTFNQSNYTRQNKFKAMEEPVEYIPAYTPKNKNYVFDEDEFEDYNSHMNIYTPPIKQNVNLLKPPKQQITNPQQYKPITNILDLSTLEMCKYSSTLARDQAGCRLLQKKIEEDRLFADEIFSYVI